MTTPLTIRPDGAFDFLVANHVLEHVTLASTGLLYWWHLISPIRRRLRFGPVRRFRASTRLGRVFDPIVDVLFNLGIAVFNRLGRELNGF